MVKKTTIASISFLTGFFIFASVCSAATLSFGGSGSETVGQTFSVPVYVSAAQGESLNAVSATITFPPQKLRVVLVDDTGIVDFWVQKPSYSNANGTVTFQGVTYNPGFSGQEGIVVNVTFRAIASGTAQLAFSAPSVLANDGEGTDILTSSNPVSITIQNAIPVQQSSTPPVSTAATTPALTTASKATTTVAISSATQSRTSTTLTNVLTIFGLGLIGVVLILLLWFIWHRMHHTRRRLLRYMASTDTVLHAELFELHNALKEEIKRLTLEKADRELTAEEKHILVRFTHLVEKTERVLEQKAHKK